MINLATELKKNKHKVIFLTKTPILKNLLKRKFKCVVFSKYISGKTVELVKDFNPAICIIDKFQENSINIKILKKLSQSLVAIDYTGKNKRLIKNGINILYPKTGISTKTSKAEFEFTILNNSFVKLRPISIKKKTHSIIILQGGSDTPCYTPEIIQSVYSFSNELKISVVLGPSFKCWKKLKKAVKNKKSLKIYHNVKNLASLIHKHDMAITGGGMTLLELCHLGIPCVIICGASFENETAKILAKNGYGINLGYNRRISKRRIRNAIIQLMNDYEYRKKMNKIGRTLVDNKGSKRVIKEILVL